MEKLKVLLMLKIPLILFALVFLAVPAASVDPDKWDLITHQEIVPQQSFPVEDYTITLADRETNGLGDYTAVVYIEYNGNKINEYFVFNINVNSTMNVKDLIHILAAKHFYPPHTIQIIYNNKLLSTDGLLINELNNIQSTIIMVVYEKYSYVMN